MKTQFDWQVGDMEDESEATSSGSRSGVTRGSLWFLVAAALIAVALLVSWQLGQAQLARSERRLKERVQQILDLEHEAILEGDGEIFFSVQSNDPSWLVAQLLPENQQASRAGLTITRARSRENFIWANLTWTIAGRTWQRIAFFEWQDNQLVHVPTDPDYWGNQLRSRHAWGELVYYAVDDARAVGIAAVVEDMVAEICADGCLAGRRPFRLTLAPDYARTAAPNEIRVPSPRLVALIEDGRPASLFWRQLRRNLEDHLLPATITFAVPPASPRDGLTQVDYQPLAERFMQAQPEVEVEIVVLGQLPDDRTTLALDYDGVAGPPTEAMIAAGLVLDLTDYAQSDPRFDQADFYEQIWQGATWQERTWFMPQEASMRVLYYDRAAYRRAGLPEPSMRWTWEEMARDVAGLISAQPESSDLIWGFLDVDVDSFLSYAYNWNNRCTEAVTILCQNQLQTQNVAAAYEWYGQLRDSHGYVSGLFGLDAAERDLFLLNSQTAFRKAAIWVDRPAYYELQLLLSPIGVVSFPGSDRFDGITPLWVRGGFISQHSERPRAVWEWLKFLSYQRPAPRLVPARPSVAQATNFWEVLPLPLGNVMRTAFPFARPVSIEEQAVLSWDLIAEGLSGNLSPLEAAQQRPELQWFQR